LPFQTSGESVLRAFVDAVARHEGEADGWLAHGVVIEWGFGR
jgi:hypothetical protein